MITGSLSIANASALREIFSQDISFTEKHSHTSKVKQRNTGRIFVQLQSDEYLLDKRDMLVA